MKESIVDECLIYVDRLQHGKEHVIAMSIAPDFIAVNEEELKFLDQVEVEGKAYLAENELIVHLDVKTFVEVPCLICNAPVKMAIELKDYYDIRPASEVKSRIYDFRIGLRDELLLNIPHTAECNQGSCPKRKEYKKYLKSGHGSENDNEGNYCPFENL